MWRFYFKALNYSCKLNLAIVAHRPWHILVYQSSFNHLYSTNNQFYLQTTYFFTKFYCIGPTDGPFYHNAQLVTLSRQVSETSTSQHSNVVQKSKIKKP
jgi:hypothetical protein